MHLCSPKALWSDQNKWRSLPKMIDVVQAYIQTYFITTWRANLIHNPKHPCVFGARGAISMPNDSVICDVLTCNVRGNLGHICLKDVCQLRKLRRTLCLLRCAHPPQRTSAITSRRHSFCLFFCCIFTLFSDLQILQKNAKIYSSCFI